MSDLTEVEFHHPPSQLRDSDPVDVLEVDKERQDSFEEFRLSLPIQSYYHLKDEGWDTRVGVGNVNGPPESVQRDHVLDEPLVVREDFYLRVSLRARVSSWTEPTVSSDLKSFEVERRHRSGERRVLCRGSRDEGSGWCKETDVKTVKEKTPLGKGFNR